MVLFSHCEIRLLARAPPDPDDAGEEVGEDGFGAEAAALGAGVGVDFAGVGAGVGLTGAGADLVGADEVVEVLVATVGCGCGAGAGFAGGAAVDFAAFSFCIFSSS